MIPHFKAELQPPVITTDSSVYPAAQCIPMWEDDDGHLVIGHSGINLYRRGTIGTPLRTGPSINRAGANLFTEAASGQTDRA